ncbi:MAG: hypothetical protein JWR72_540 [Flavisolibacter sp.]|jgi:hypothetical protein|nr:hypothetical protein [Flavisolibacter sp.]
MTQRLRLLCLQLIATTFSFVDFFQKKIITGSVFYDAVTIDRQGQIYQTTLATGNIISLSGRLVKLPYLDSLGFATRQGVLFTAI